MLTNIKDSVQRIESVYDNKYEIQIALASKENKKMNDGFMFTAIYEDRRSDKEYRFYYEVSEDEVVKLIAEEYQKKVASRIVEFYEKMYFPWYIGRNITLSRRKKLKFNRQSCYFANNVDRWRVEFKKEHYKKGKVNPVIILKDPVGYGYIIIEGCHRLMAAFEEQNSDSIEIDTWLITFRQKTPYLPLDFKTLVDVIPFNRVEVVEKDIPFFDLFAQGIIEGVSSQQTANKIFKILSQVEQKDQKYIGRLQELSKEVGYVGKVAKKFIDLINAESKTKQSVEEWTLAMVGEFDKILDEELRKVTPAGRPSVDMAGLMKRAFADEKLGSEIKNMAEIIKGKIDKLKEKEDFYNEANTILSGVPDARVHKFLDITASVAPVTVYSVFANISQGMSFVELSLEDPGEFGEDRENIEEFWYKIIVLSLAYRMAHGSLSSIDNVQELQTQL